jgi:hypothetical protein
MGRRRGLRWVLLLAGIGAMQSPARAGSDDRSYQIQAESRHPWTPPFGLDRVGQSGTVSILAIKPPQLTGYRLTVLLRGREVGRHAVSIPSQPPYSVRIAIGEYGDEAVLSAEKVRDGERIELLRQPLSRPRIEIEASARPDVAVNPVDLGTILVPHDWLLLGPDQGGILDVAALCREGNEQEARVCAWFGSAPREAVTTPAPLQANKKLRLSLNLPRASKTLDRDVLHVSLVDGRRAVLWQKSIPVMLVQKRPLWPRFGATYTKLRYDAPISVRDPKTGAYSSLKYEDGWAPALQDVVVSLPNGARFVFWRGSSYIPFWAGQHNTGASYEWAEVISPIKGAVDCVEPLMDKELRYGRVEIVESTKARVHVRWTYQSTDLHYQVWGDEVAEDYYFYPDAFGTRVLTLKSDPAHEYEISEFIILTPQGAYPLDVLPESLVDSIGLDGRKWSFRFPSPPGELAAMRRAMAPPTIYRLRLNKEEAQSALYFSPMDRKFPETIFGPFSDRGQVVTPCYWGSHWPLARGNATGWAIDDRISLTPCHNSLLSWTKARPEPIRSAERVCLDAQGRSRLMSLRTWAWLIGMSNASDNKLIMCAISFSSPPSLEVQGGKLDFESYDSRRRALRLHVQDQTVTIKVKPQIDCVNPVFELLGAPGGPLTVWRDGAKMSPDHYAWDGRTLWLEATIEAPSDLKLDFGATARPTGR